MFSSARREECCKPRAWCPHRSPGFVKCRVSAGEGEFQGGCFWIRKVLAEMQGNGVQHKAEAAEPSGVHPLPAAGEGWALPGSYCGAGGRTQLLSSARNALWEQGQVGWVVLVPEAGSPGEQLLHSAGGRQTRRLCCPAAGLQRPGTAGRVPLSSIALERLGDFPGGWRLKETLQVVTQRGGGSGVSVFSSLASTVTSPLRPDFHCTNTTARWALQARCAPSRRPHEAAPATGKLEPDPGVSVPLL